MRKLLVIGASGNVGSQVVAALDKINAGDVEVVLATSKPQTAERWCSEGRAAVVLDLADPATFPEALAAVDGLFLLTGYTADMLFQSKMLVDAAAEAGVGHIVHLGTYTSRRDPLPHFSWHDLVESYIAASDIAWTNVHPNVIVETTYGQVDFSADEIILTNWGDVPQGYACTADIGEVAATALYGGPEKHAGKDYYLSIEVLDAKQMEAVFAEATGKPVRTEYATHDGMAAMFAQIQNPGTATYMQSALKCYDLTVAGEFAPQTAVRDDVMTVCGHPGTTMRAWVERRLHTSVPEGRG